MPSVGHQAFQERDGLTDAWMPGEPRRVVPLENSGLDQG